MKNMYTTPRSFSFFALLLGLIVLNSCREEEVENEGLPLPVISLKETSAAKNFEYVGSIEGVESVEIRPQVDGILEEIYVDEGEFVTKGQPLFKVNSQPYMEDYKNAVANVNLEKAKLEKAQSDVERLQPLIDNEVISEVRMKSVKADYQVALSSLQQAQSQAANMRINLDFTTIKAPVNGFMGRIPKSIGNVVKQTDSEPLTNLSNVNDIYVYFSMSESDYLYFERAKNDTLSNRVNDEVKLVLADGSIYENSGQIDANSGQIDRTTGSIMLRAKFNNPDTLLRSGNTGKILMEEIYPSAILVPQSATTFIQDKKFVFILDENNLAQRREIITKGRSGDNYIVDSKSLSPDDRIVLSGIDKLASGIKVKPIQRGQLTSSL
ncbi:efflux RND transporter periplasmic adaptor subunit [Leeuwenhoekiella marinoflava]|uniref:Membrane fusion protein (Multidrug efflux system) n=2 Tax=Leeuwenhoekiella marinoflava TaxID=988 RepID=A0A4Q0PLG4_9FLAO|nr:efflux RND transporter periplasmic adaptor subunit [Leeuwenhoekiella marinoflava]RXG28436.1 membrane fusion protein (multidrug efflux system) [Leeuwenhoekiella marinoflava]SHF51822.1 membrane fusion protein, multidrug efflux system [Leeuwenhoekiella marinoflava DSM 3653]